MALADYRLCDICDSKCFYDAHLNYETGLSEYGATPYKVNGNLQALDLEAHNKFGNRLDYLGDWAVLCRECAQKHKTVILPQSQEVAMQIHPPITPADAVYGLLAWLSGREEVVTLSACHGAAIAADLAKAFCEENGILEFSATYPDNLKYPQCTHEQTVRPEILEDDFGLVAGRLEAGNPISGWILIEEDAKQEVPMETPVLLGWWETWPEMEWVCEAGIAGVDRPGVGWRHGRATHWMPLPSPPVEAQRQEGGV